MYYTSYEGALVSQELAGAPFGYWWANPAPPEFATPYIDRPSGLDRGQRFPALVPPLNVGPKNPMSGINWSQFEPISSSPSLFPSNNLPYNEDYSLSLQRQLGRATLFSLSYVGTEGHRLMGTVEANVGNPATCLSVSQASEVTNGVTCGPFGENGIYYPVSGGEINSTRSPFGPNFGNKTGTWPPWRTPITTRLRCRCAAPPVRLEFFTGYTYSKSLDNASGSGLGQGDNINPLNFRSTKALSAFDATHNLVVSYNYRLPFDKIGCANRLTNGWGDQRHHALRHWFPCLLDGKRRQLASRHLWGRPRQPGRRAQSPGWLAEYPGSAQG